MATLPQEFTTQQVLDKVCLEEDSDLELDQCDKKSVPKVLRGQVRTLKVWGVPREVTKNSSELWNKEEDGDGDRHARKGQHVARGARGGAGSFQVDFLKNKTLLKNPIWQPVAGVTQCWHSKENITTNTITTPENH